MASMSVLVKAACGPRRACVRGLGASRCGGLAVAGAGRLFAEILAGFFAGSAFSMGAGWGCTAARWWCRGRVLPYTRRGAVPRPLAGGRGRFPPGGLRPRSGFAMATRPGFARPIAIRATRSRRDRCHARRLCRHGAGDGHGDAGQQHRLHLDLQELDAAGDGQAPMRSMRFSSSPTWTGVQLPPRLASTLRAVSSRAMARRPVMPCFWIAAMTGARPRA